MNPWRTPNGVIDPRLLEQDRLQRPYIPGPPVLPNNPPSPANNIPAEVDSPETLFQQSIEEAARAWFGALPLNLQERLPQDPLQAFRRVLIDPDVVPPVHRYQMIQEANRVAITWVPVAPAEIRRQLPSQALEAFQAAVMRVTANQRPPAPTVRPTAPNAPQTIQQPSIADQVLREQQESLPQGIQAGAPHYGLRPRAPRVPPAPQAVVPRDPDSNSMDTTGSGQEPHKRDPK